MEPESLLQNTRWEVLSAIAQSPKSASAIAKETRSSIANVSQQLKLLEAYGFVESGRMRKGRPGKPRRPYNLKKPYCRIVLLAEGTAQKRSFSPSPFQMLLARAMFLARPEDQECLVKHLCRNEEILERCAIAHLKSSENEIHLLYVTGDVEHVRKHYSNEFVIIHGRERKIAAWTHSVQEIREGLDRNDPYYTDFMKSLFVLHDPNEVFSVLRGEGGIS